MKLNKEQIEQIQRAQSLSGNQGDSRVREISELTNIPFGDVMHYLLFGNK